MALTTVRPQGMGFNTGRRNLIINGAMQVAQRGTSTASVTTGNIYTSCDRWSNSGNTFGTFTLSQSTETPAGFSNSFKYDCTTANASLSANSHLGLVQKFEGQNLQMLEKGTSTAKPITVSFWVKSNKTGDYTLEVDDRDNTRAFSKKYTIDSANTWEFKSLTFVGDTTGALDNDNAHSFSCSWWLANGSDWTSGTFTTGWEARTTANRATPNQVNLADNTANEWYITGVQLELGTNASDFEHRSFGEELSLCQRYYETLIIGAGNFDIASTERTADDDRAKWDFKVRKRANCTAALGAGGSWGTGTPTFYNGFENVNFNRAGIFNLNGTGGTIGLIADSEL